MSLEGLKTLCDIEYEQRTHCIDSTQPLAHPSAPQRIPTPTQLQLLLSLLPVVLSFSPTIVETPGRVSKRGGVGRWTPHVISVGMECSQMSGVH